MLLETYLFFPSFFSSLPQRSSAQFFNCFFKLFEILVSQESPYFSHNPWQISQLEKCSTWNINENMPGYMVTLTNLKVRYRQLQYIKLLRKSKRLDYLNQNFKFTSLDLMIFQMKQKTKFWIWDCAPFTYLVNKVEGTKNGVWWKKHREQQMYRKGYNIPYKWA